MNADLLKKIKMKYKEAGFEFHGPDENLIIFQNKFSIHYLFYCDSFTDAQSKFTKYHEIFTIDYLNKSYKKDLYWNFYEIFIFQTKPSNNFLEFKENIEKDVSMSRKYVLIEDNLDLLPLLFFQSTSTKQPTTEESPWEKEWKEAIGENLYDKIMETTKSNIYDVVIEYIDDKVNNTK